MFFRKSGEDSENNAPRKKEEADDQWDKKKILTFLFFGIVALLIAFEIKQATLGDKSILGESTTKKSSEIKKPNIETPRVNVESQVSSTVEDIKKSISEIDAKEVASSSPQIQKVLNDIQGIRDLPINRAKEACFKICSGI